MTTEDAREVYSAKAIEAITEAADNEHDFSGWLAFVVSEVVSRRGWDAVEGRPGSWEASLVERLVEGTLGNVPLHDSDERSGE